jgi:ABC-type uncharacterized transport system ATPase subunit
MSNCSIETRDITKSFATTLACDAIDLKIYPGEIHALLGENGAGKTTLMRILSGFMRPDAGTILLDGEPIQLESPGDAMRLGIGMVHQRYRLIESFTVADNLLLGSSFDGRASAFYRHVEEIGKHFGIAVRPDAYVWELSDGERQRVEIVRVLQRGARILILDEPTGVLSPQECGELFGALKRMSAEGKSVVLISHKMEEVLEWCDRITVIRKGRKVLTKSATGVSAAELAEMTIGSEISVASSKRQLSPGKVVLNFDGICASGAQPMSSLKDVSFILREREILGVAGLSGNGQTELAEVCAGLAQSSRGRIVLCGRDITSLGVATASAAGMAFIPEDRVGTGVCSNLGTDENLILRDLKNERFARWGLLDRDAIQAWAREKVSEFDIRLPDISGPIRRLSGGNMQKVVLARELSRPITVLVAAQPIRGLDVAAAEAVHRMILDARDRGAAVLLISEDLDEITKLSDRMIVMHRGEITAELLPDASREQIGLAMAGVRLDRPIGRPAEQAVLQPT